MQLVLNVKELKNLLSEYDDEAPVLMENLTPGFYRNFYIYERQIFTDIERTNVVTGLILSTKINLYLDVDREKLAERNSMKPQNPIEGENLIKFIDKHLERDTTELEYHLQDISKTLLDKEPALDADDRYYYEIALLHNVLSRKPSAKTNKTCDEICSELVQKIERYKCKQN